MIFMLGEVESCCRKVLNFLSRAVSWFPSLLISVVQKKNDSVLWTIFSLNKSITAVCMISINFVFGIDIN